MLDCNSETRQHEQCLTKAANKLRTNMSSNDKLYRENCQHEQGTLGTRVICQHPIQWIKGVKTAVPYLHQQEAKKLFFIFRNALVQEKQIKNK